jgi:hypothetical protein
MVLIVHDDEREGNRSVGNGVDVAGVIAWPKRR